MTMRHGWVSDPPTKPCDNLLVEVRRTFRDGEVEQEYEVAQYRLDYGGCYLDRNGDRITLPPNVEPHSGRHWTTEVVRWQSIEGPEE